MIGVADAAALEADDDVGLLQRLLGERLAAEIARRAGGSPPWPPSAVKRASASATSRS